MEQIIGAASAATADLVKDSDAAHFAVDVIEASQSVPVIVDFWAPWCGPCKQLGPAIERAVKAAAGKVKLVKINVDENQEVAAQLRVKSIPAVFAFKDGQPVDGFVGALPESQIKAFISRLTGDSGPGPVEQALEQADALLAEGAAAEAAEIYAQVLGTDTANPKATGGLARAMIATGDLARAKELLDSVDETLASHAEITGARAALDLAEQSSAAGGADMAALRARLEKDPGDTEARFDLGMALFQVGEQENAVDAMVEIVRRNRAWNDEAARKQLLTFFEAIGHSDPVTVEGRRKLSSVLFS